MGGFHEPRVWRFHKLNLSHWSRRGRFRLRICGGSKPQCGRFWQVALWSSEVSVNLGNKRSIVHPCWLAYAKYMLILAEQNLSSLTKMFFWLCNAGLQPCILIVLWGTDGVQTCLLSRSARNIVSCPHLLICIQIYINNHWMQLTDLA